MGEVGDGSMTPHHLVIGTLIPSPENKKQQSQNTKKKKKNGIMLHLCWVKRHLYLKTNQDP